MRDLQKTEVLEYVATEHLRMPGAYWGLTAMDLMDSLGMMEEEQIIGWILKCQHPNGEDILCTWHAGNAQLK